MSARHERFDVVLVGAGIMSVTMATLLRELDPRLSILVLERLGGPALESSDGWNNAGTGHAANCEMNYTPQRPDGSVDVTQALEINVEFDLSRQLWAHLVRTGAITQPDRFIQPCPHISFVTGTDNVAFLKERHRTMTASHCFAGMEYSEDRATIGQWAPIVMEGRDAAEPVAATRMVTGSDVDYGTLTRMMVEALDARPGFEIRYHEEVHGLRRADEGGWIVSTRPHGDGRRRRDDVHAGQLFVGAGGGSLELLEKSGIPEGRGYGGFPVSGIWLRCDDPAVVARHKVKVYGKAAHGSPPMSVPHLDMRVVDDQHSILFGPFAGFSSKFLKEGSYLDLFRTVRLSNIGPLLDVAAGNLKLEEYLADQMVLSEADRIGTLKTFYPHAVADDWKEAVAGQRVEIIKPDAEGHGTLQLGTELVVSEDRTLMALLGASPGASTAVATALNSLRHGFPDRMTEAGWLPRLRQIIPTYGIDLRVNAEACRSTRATTASVLGLVDL